MNTSAIYTSILGTENTLDPKILLILWGHWMDSKWRLAWAAICGSRVIWQLSNLKHGCVYERIYEVIIYRYGLGKRWPLQCSCSGEDYADAFLQLTDSTSDRALEDKPIGEAAHVRLSWVTYIEVSHPDKWCHCRCLRGAPLGYFYTRDRL